MTQEELEREREEAASMKRLLQEQRQAELARQIEDRNRCRIRPATRQPMQFWRTSFPLRRLQIGGTDSNGGGRGGCKLCDPARR